MQHFFATVSTGEPARGDETLDVLRDACAAAHEATAALRKVEQFAEAT